MIHVATHEKLEKVPVNMFRNLHSTTTLILRIHANMPPRVAKRKASSSSGDSEAPAKRVKAVKAIVPPGAQPTNKTMPENIVFKLKAPETIRIAAWNVCGLAASKKKGFEAYVVAEDPDILVLSETKMNVEPIDEALKARYPFSYWSFAEKKGYAGTAILSKHKAISVSLTLPGHPDLSAAKGRLCVLEFEGLYVVGTYVVNAGTGLKTLDAKKEWNSHFENYIRELDKIKPVIWTGDLNVAPTELDLTNGKRNWNKTAGYTEAETTSFRNILEGIDSNPAAPTEESEDLEEVEPKHNKFVDMWRDLHPTDRHYTYFSYRFDCRSKGLGWRLDTFVLSERLKERVKMCEIRSEIYGASDHCPVVLEISGAL